MKNGQSLLDICQLVNGRAFKQSEWSESGLPIIRIQNLNDATKEFNYFQGIFDPKHEVNSGDLLFSWSGTPGTSFGAFFWERGKGLLNQHIFNVRVNEQTVAKPYLRYALNQKLSEIIGRAHGAVGLQHITKAELSRLQIPLPPLPVQQRIAAILDAADALRAKRRESIEQLDSLIQSTFLEMFGDPVTNPKGWEAVPLGHACDLTNGRAFKPSEWEETGLPIIRIQNLNDTEKPFNYTTKRWSQKFFARTRDILLSWSGTPGTSFGCFRWLGPDGWVNQHIFRVTTKPMVEQTYFIHAVNARLNEIISKAHGGVGLKHITKSKLEDVAIATPPLDLQTRFASIVESIEQQKARLKANLAELDTLFASLQSRAFNGELVA